MAQPGAEAQPELFPLLDGEQAVGVFYFPATSISLSDQLNEVVCTIEHLQTLNAVLAKHKINAAAAPKFSPVVKFLARFEYRLQREKEKMLALNDSSLHSTPDSTYHEKVGTNGK